MEITPEILNQGQSRTLAGLMGIEFTKTEKGYVEATMPVDHRTHQPFGILHGGASAALAETLGSVGSLLLIDPQTHVPVGIELNANHLRSKSDGVVTGKAKAVHAGSRTHVWQIDIVDENDKLICTSRLTVMIVERNDK